MSDNTIVSTDILDIGNIKMGRPKITDSIKNCHPEFEFVCPKSWSDLRVVERGSMVRFCDQCKQNVYLCGTGEEMEEHAKLGHCVAMLNSTW